MSTNLKYGVNITESDVQNMLEQNQKQQNGVKTWRTLLGGAGVGYNAGRDAALSSFSDTVAQAYDASLANKSAIYASGLNAGATKNLLRDNASSLHQAYESALSNYNKNLAAATDTYQKETGTIVTDLQTEAKNYTELLNKSYDYLKELYGANQTIPVTAEIGAAEKYEGSGKNTEFKGYEDVNLNYLQDNDLGWVLDDAGALRSWQDIQADMFDDDDNLNARGVQFFDAVYNADPQNYMVTNAETNETSKLRSFDEYLSDVSPELRNWYVSSDQYNATRAGTKRGSLNVLTGRESDDFLYNKNNYKVYSTDKLNQIGAEFGATGELAGKAAKANDEFNYFQKSGVDATYDYTALENEVAQAKAKIDELSKKSVGSAADSAAIRHAYAVYEDAQNRLDEAKGSPEYAKYTATGEAGRKAENDANSQRAEAEKQAKVKLFEEKRRIASEYSPQKQAEYEANIASTKEAYEAAQAAYEAAQAKNKGGNVRNPKVRNEVGAAARKVATTKAA